MKNFFLVLITFFLNGALLSQTTGTIRGSAIDAQSKEPVPFSRITVEKEMPDSTTTPVSATTNMEGEFVFRYLEVGHYTIRAFFPDYIRQSIKHVVVKENLNSFVHIKLDYKKGNADPEEVYNYAAPANPDKPNIIREEYINVCGDRTDYLKLNKTKEDSLKKSK